MLMIRLASLVPLVVALLMGCNFAGPPTASPVATSPLPSSSATVPAVTVIQTPAPADTAARTPTDVETPEPTEDATPSPSPTEPTTSDVWRRVPNFPPVGAHVSAVLAAGPGFVAVGYHGDDEYPCDQLTVDGRIWTSSDGEHWDESDPDALDGLFLTKAVNADGTIYAFGLVGDPDCAQDEVSAFARSPDGISWDRLRIESPAPGLYIPFGAMAGTLIALGEDHSWTSVDGEQWQRGGDVPFSYDWFEEIAALGETAVAFKDFAVEPVWFSSDAAESWSIADFEPLYDLAVLDTTVGDGLIVAVGQACCGLPNAETGLSVTSTDGRTWHESAAFAEVPQAVVAISDGYLTVSRDNWVSRDGLDWHVGPRLPDFDSRSTVSAVSADVGVFVINGELSWFAPAESLSGDRQSEAPRNAEMPEIGVRYEAEVFLHCGWPPIYFGLETWLADPPFEDNINPPPGFGDEDRGWLTQLDENELVYESRRGQTVNLRLSQEAEASGPCA